MKMYDKIIDWLNREAEAAGSTAKLAENLGAARSTFHKVLRGDSRPAEALFDWMEQLGATVQLPDEPQDTIREVCFVDAEKVSATNGPPADSERYLAVPLVGQAGAGPGIMGPAEIFSWILVYRYHRSVLNRSNLLAVEVGENQRSMAPTLNPLDIILLDRNDIHAEPAPPGNIFLVQEPGPEYAKSVKRVVFERKRHGLNIVFYSDNAVEHPPRTFDFEAEYGGDITKALIGRVVWAWSDMTRK